MAAAVATLNITPYPQGRDATQQRWKVSGKCVLSSGGTYLTNGIPVGIQTGNAGAGSWVFIDPANGSQEILSSQNPVPVPGTVIFQSQTGVATGPVQYTYLYDYTHFTLRIFAAGTELTNTAAIAADTILFTAEFMRAL